MKKRAPKAAQRKVKKIRLAMTSERAAEILAELLDRSVSRAVRSLDETHREVKRSTHRIAAMEKAHVSARSNRKSAIPRTVGTRRSVLGPLERELVDYLKRYVDKQVQAMAKRLDRTDRRLEEQLARIEQFKRREKLATPKKRPR